MYVKFWESDLTSYTSVHVFTKRALSELSKIDVLLQNAGVATKKFELVESHERTITVNVISTFLLVLLLLPKLEETTSENPPEKPRWSIVTSEVHAVTIYLSPKTENHLSTSMMHKVKHESALPNHQSYWRC
jgi:retinol dehydrogenase 12